MKAITLDQPVAWMVINDQRNIKDRRWPTKHRGKILIHASVHRVTSGEYEQFLGECHRRGITRYPLIKGFKTGGIVGSVEIVDCIKPATSGLFGPYTLMLTNPQKLPFIRMRGIDRVWKMRKDKDV